MLRRYFLPLLALLLLLVGALYFLFGRGNAPASVRDAVPVERFTLRNGLTLVVMPNDRIPAVTNLLLVKAGGADDPYGKTGLAHYLEHLMFSGTKDYPEGAFGKRISRLGGRHNAYTSYDYTAYYATVPKEALAQVMAMDVDRFRHTKFDAAAARELKVISEERAMRVENNPSALLGEQLDALTFLNHPYHHPLIGWAEDMESFTAEDAKRWFRRHYAPSNMILVVAGDVAVKDVRRLAQQYYGALPAAKSPVRHWPKEPPLRVVRHATLQDKNVQSPRLVRQYVAPGLVEGRTEHALPLSLLAQYLGGGDTSLLYQELVRRQKIAASVHAEYDPFSIGPALFRIRVTPAPGVSLARLEKALDGVVNGLLGDLPQEAALRRAKVQLKAETTFAQDGLEPLAQLMAALYAIGKDETTFYRWAEEIETITALQMLDAAQTVLAPERRVTGYLLPDRGAGEGNALRMEEARLEGAIEPAEASVPASDAQGVDDEAHE